MKILVLLVVLIAITETVSDDEALSTAWNTFKEEFGKTYENEIEEEFRKNTFMARMYRITEHNSKYELGLVSFKLGINKYSDMPHDEFVRTMTGSEPESFEDNKKSVEVEFAKSSIVNLASEVDWRKKGAVTEVKDQGRCRACWAFSAIGALEGLHFRKTGKLLSLSEQHLIDCTTSYGNEGCGDGTMTSAFKYAMDYGVEAEETYPFEGKKLLACYYAPWNIVTNSMGYTNIAEGDEEGLQAAVAKRGPVSAGFDASLDSFQDYTSGVYYDAKCSSDRKKLHHALVVVGYGTEGGKDYWLAKNSWSKTWGDEGYVKVARNKKSHCGIASQATYPIF